MENIKDLRQRVETYDGKTSVQLTCKTEDGAIWIDTYHFYNEDHYDEQEIIDIANERFFKWIDQKRSITEDPLKVKIANELDWKRTQEEAISDLLTKLNSSSTKERYKERLRGVKDAIEMLERFLS